MEEEKKKEYFIIKVGDSSFIGLDWKPIEKDVAYGIESIEPDSIAKYIIHSDVDRNNKPLNILSIPGVDNMDNFVKIMPEYEKDADGNNVKYKMTDTSFSGCVTKVVENYKQCSTKKSKKGSTKKSKKGSTKKSKKGGCPCSASGGCPCSASGGCPCSASGGCPCSASGGCPCSASGGKKGSKKSKKGSKKSKKGSKKSKKGGKKGSKKSKKGSKK